MKNISLYVRRVKLLFIILTFVIMLTACSKETTYTVGFFTSGGNSIEDVSVLEGESVGEPGIPIKEGYTFLGWYSDNEYIIAYNFLDEVIEDLTIYAKWSEVTTYTVEFFSSGGNSIEDVSVLEGQSVEEPSIPIKEGYTFLGWYSDNEFISSYNFLDEVIDDLTLYAKWSEDLPEYYEVSLLNGEIVIQEIIDSISGTDVILPILKEEGKIFIGWTDETNTYYDEYTVTSNTTLTAVFEVVSEVFEYETIPETDNERIAITEYTGNATHLIIPQTIDGFIVETLAPYLFENSDLIEVSIPIDAFVGFNAFLNSSSLIEMSFYGELLLTTTTDTIGGVQYYELIDQNSEVCEITSGSIEEGSWVFQDECPIKEVLNYDSIVINEIEYSNYTVKIDKDYSTNSIAFSFGLNSFKGATSLETIQIPKNNSVFFVDSFTECPNIKYINVDDESDFFTVVDGVLYNKALTITLFHPNGLETNSYTIPDTIEGVNIMAFYENTNLEVIVVNEYYNSEFIVLGLSGLKEFIVDENNESYTTVDGILFKGTELVKYPASKLGSSYVVPQGIYSIGYSAFENNVYLESIDLGNEITSINDRAFFGSKLITELDIPSSVEFIGMYIVVYSNVDIIIINRSVIIDGSITRTYGFGPIYNDNLIIFVPDDSIAEYSTDLFLQYHIDIIYPISEYPTE